MTYQDHYYAHSFSRIYLELEVEVEVVTVWFLYHVAEKRTKILFIVYDLAKVEKKYIYILVDY